MSKLKLWKPFSLFIALLLMLPLAAMIPAPVKAAVSGINVTPYDTRFIGANTGYQITLTTGSSLNASDNITIVFPSDTYVPAGLSASSVFVKGTVCSSVLVSGQQVTVIIPAIAPIVPFQQFVITFNKGCGIVNPNTSGSKTVTVWTNVEPAPVTSNSYEITAVKVFTGGTTFLSEHAHIANAIIAASAGDTITVPAGTYTENLNVNKSLTLQGANSAAVTVIALDPAVSVFTVTTNNVNISGFTAIGTTITGNQGYAGIKFDAGVANCNIHDNIVSSNQYGILMLGSLGDTTLRNNTFTSNTASNCGVSGIEAQNTNGNTFTNNTANSNGAQGFRLANAKNNTLTGNTANLNGTATIPGGSGGVGIFLVIAGGTGSNNNIFTANSANWNVNHGLRIDNGTGNTMTGNTFNSNGADGIKLKVGNDNTTMINNTCSFNVIGIEIASPNSATSITLRNNNIIGNSAYGVSNTDTGILNAKQNYWGHASGPGHDFAPAVTYGDKVSTNVNFSPWLVITFAGTAPTGEITISTTSPIPDGNTSTAYSKTFSTTGGAGSYNWAYYSGLVPGLSFNSNNFSGTPTTVLNDPGYNFAIQVSDGVQATYGNFVMNVFGNAPVITNTSLTNGTINVPYGPVTLQAISGGGIYTWSINSGTLPNGLTLVAATGIISGTPTAAGTFNFNVRVVSSSQSGYKDLSITINTPSAGQKLLGADAAAVSTVSNSSNYLIMSKFTASATGSMTQFKINCSAAGNVKVAIYADNAGQPDVLLTAVNTSTPVVAGWNILTFPSTTITSGVNYWLAFNSDTAIVGAKSGVGNRRYMAAAFSTFTFPATGNPPGLNTNTNFYDLSAGWSVAAVPTVTNSTGASFTATSATLNGTITDTGGENPTVIIYWGLTDGSTDPYTWDNSVNLGIKSAGAFSTDITSLSASTVYFYRCFAANAGGNGWATSSASFSTSSLGAPAVNDTAGASNITAVSVRLNGAVTDTGGDNTNVIVYWGDNDGGTNLNNWDHSVNLGTKNVGAFFTDITGLSASTAYYYRCYASNSGGTIWAGSSATFNTPSAGQKLLGADAAAVSTVSNSSNYLIMSKFTASATGSMTQFKINCSAAGNVKVAIYADNAGQPDVLLTAVNTSTPVVAGWNILTFPSTTITSGVNYWLAFNSDTAIVGAKSGVGNRRYMAAAFSTFTFPATGNLPGLINTDTTFYDLNASWGSSSTPVVPLASPSLVTPKAAITFEWAATSGATKYRLQVNTASDFTGTSMFDTEVSTTSQVVALPVGSTYFWRVEAGNTGGWSSWSAIGNIKL